MWFPTLRAKALEGWGTRPGGTGHPEMAARRAAPGPNSRRVFGQTRKPAKMLCAGLYDWVSTSDQQPVALLIRAPREYATRRGLTIALQLKEGGSGASQRQLRRDCWMRRAAAKAAGWRKSADSRFVHPATEPSPNRLKGQVVSHQKHAPQKVLSWLQSISQSDYA